MVAANAAHSAMMSARCRRTNCASRIATAVVGLDRYKSPTATEKHKGLGSSGARAEPSKPSKEEEKDGLRAPTGQPSDQSRLVAGRAPHTVISAADTARPTSK